MPIRPLRKIPRSKEVAWLLGVLILVLLTGCGSGKTQVSVTTPTHVTPPEATQAATPTPSTPAVKPPDFVLEGQTVNGDKARVEGRFGPALPPAQSDANQAALNECGEASNGRELVVRLDLTTTVQSGLAANVTIKDFHTRSLSSKEGISEFLMGYAEGPSCHSNEVELSSLQPQASNSFTIWVILQNAISPNNPHPTAKDLGLGWGMNVPTVYINNVQTTKGVAFGGPRVLHCKYQTVPEEDDFAIPVAGTTPTTTTLLMGPENVRVFCAKTPIPKQ